MTPQFSKDETRNDVSRKRREKDGEQVNNVDGISMEIMMITIIISVQHRWKNLNPFVRFEKVAGIFSIARLVTPGVQSRCFHQF